MRCTGGNSWEEIAQGKEAEFSSVFKTLGACRSVKEKKQMAVLCLCLERVWRPSDASQTEGGSKGLCLNVENCQTEHRLLIGPFRLLLACAQIEVRCPSDLSISSVELDRTSR